MAQTWEQKRLKHEKDMLGRLNDEMGTLAEDVNRVMRRYAGLNGSLPNTRAFRGRVPSLVGGVVEPYFVGANRTAFDGASPQSKYASLLFDGIKGAIQIQAERQVGVIKKYATDPVVLNHLTRPRVYREMGPLRWLPLLYDPFHLFVYGDSPYRLSDRVWLTSGEVRARIDGLLDYHIQRGTSAVQIANMLVAFLTREAAGITTRKPYGTVGSYAARRLARTEITAAAGRAILNASQNNPYVTGEKWNLSPSHPKIDICDDHASGGPRGDGVYEKGNFPAYPAHPHCLCYITLEVTASPAEVTRQIRAEIDNRTEWAVRSEGWFYLTFLVAVLLYGYGVATTTE